MSEVEKNEQTNLEARVTWLEAELARITAKVDTSIGLEGYDVPTPKPAS